MYCIKRVIFLIKISRKEIVFALNTIRRSLHSHCPITRKQEKELLRFLCKGGEKSALKSFWGLLFRTIYSYFQCSLYSHTWKSKIKHRTYLSKQNCESIDAWCFYYVPTYRVEKIPRTSRTYMPATPTRTSISNICLRTYFSIQMFTCPGGLQFSAKCLAVFSTAKYY